MSVNKEEIKILEEFKKGNVKWYRCDCPEHGIFEKRKYDFLRSDYGCQKCGVNKSNEKRYKKQYLDFLRQAKEKHGDKYIYPNNIETYYNNDKINIFCKKHNEYFLQEIGRHLNGSGCPKCGFERLINSNRLTTEEVIDNCIKKRGTEDYDYSKVVWKDDSENIDVICKRHGLFNTRYFDFIKGINCPACAKEIAKEKMKKALSKNFGNALILKQNDFIEKAKQLRPEFDYSNTVWKGLKNSITFRFNGKEYKIVAKRFLKGELPKELVEKNKKIVEFSIDIELNSEYPSGTNYRKEYLKLIEKSKKNPPEINFEIHHVLPKSMFPNWKHKKSNLVKLTYEDHYRAH